MTVKEFWKYLPKTGWFFQRDGEMRRRIKGQGPKYCPLTAVAHRKLGKHISSGNYVYAARELSFDVELADDIANAADCTLEHYNQFKYSGDINRIRLRKKLLKHTGLKETK